MSGAGIVRIKTVQRFYFDHNATTPVSPEVLETAVECLGQVYGNASSIHYFGQAAKQRLENARRQAAAAMGCQPVEIVFVSGGTEADNLALFGVVRNSKRASRHVITTAIEHPAVLNACAQLEREGVAVTYAPVGADGLVDPDEIRRALRPDTVLVSVMHANNELGTVQPVADIAAMAHEAGAYMHADGVQALGKIPVDVDALGVDLYSTSGHKIYAPEGCWARCTCGAARGWGRSSLAGITSARSVRGRRMCRARQRLAWRRNWRPPAWRRRCDASASCATGWNRPFWSAFRTPA